LGGIPLLSHVGYSHSRIMRAPRLLLRSSWQVVNIGDVAHTPGVLALLEKHIPHAEVILWASKDLSDEVAAMEHRRFPKLKIVKGNIGVDGCANNSELADALTWCDFLLHGSGPSLVAAKDVESFQRHIKKPFGVYGITYAGASHEQQDLMSAAEFVYFRDSVSLGKAKSDGVSSKVMEFAPDGAFAVDLRNEELASEFLEQNQLQDGQFVCCIPRLRNTPYWKIRNQPMTEFDRNKDARNQTMEQLDHQPLLEAIIKIVEHTDLKVLLCPEDMSQMEVGKRLIYDALPTDVQKRLVWRERFWLTDHALSTYVRSAGLFGLEMHSPIMCIGNGIPAIVGRFAEQTSKGFMWRDIGLDEWLFDFDDAESKAKYPAAVLKMVTNRKASADKVAKAQQLVRDHQARTMKHLSSLLQLLV
jgi:polysaccharide pyruvyl transferase WcaK-like protein